MALWCMIVSFAAAARQCLVVKHRVNFDRKQIETRNFNTT